MRSSAHSLLSDYNKTDSQSRIASTNQLWGNILKGGAQMSMGMAMIPGLTEFAWAPAAVAGAAAGLGWMSTLGFEHYNNNYRPAGSPMLTWGNLLKTAPEYMRAEKQYTDEGIALYADSSGVSEDAIRDVMRLFNKAGADTLDDEQKNIYTGVTKSIQGLIKENEPELYASFFNPTTSTDIIQYMASQISETTGEDEGKAAQTAFNIAMDFGYTGENVSGTSIAVSTRLSQLAKANGTDVTSAYTRLAAQAVNIGYSKGSDAYREYIVDSLFNTDSEAVLTESNQQLRDSYSQQTAQYGSQLQGYFATPNMGANMVRSFGVVTQPQISAMSAAASSVQMYGGSQYETQIAAGLSTYSAPARSNVISSIAQIYGTAGLDPMTPIKMFSGAPIENNISDAGIGQNFTIPQLNLFSSVASGDMQALSYASWHQSFGPGDYTGFGNRFFDQLGDPIYQNNGRNFQNWATANGIGPNAQTGWAPGGNLQGSNWWGAFLGGPSGNGGRSEEYLQAWADGGLTGAQSYVRQQSAQYALASAGIQYQQIQAQKEYLWGSGTWDNPGEGSSWAIEDQMRALQHESQLYSFSSTEKQMAIQQSYNVASENISEERMNATQGYQRWTFGFDTAMRQRQRTWTQEDWQYQDTMSSLSYEWGVEDLNEQIRGATGRDRRNLLQQRERLTTKYNIDEEQVDTQRERQEETWAMEDERYTKVQEYQETLMELDTESFDLNKSHREELQQLQEEDFAEQKKTYAEQKKLSDEAQKLQREYQAESIALQEKSVGIQAASAKLQADLAADQETTIKKWEEFYKAAEQANTYDPANGNLKILNDVMVSAGDINLGNLLSIRDVLDSMNGNLTGASQITSMVHALANVDPYRLQALIKFLAELD